MAAVSGPTQESRGKLLPISSHLPPCLSPNSDRSLRVECLESTATSDYADHVRKRKREVNSYLPIIAESYATSTLSVEDLITFFRTYAQLYSVGIDTNSTCNLSCGYCYLDAYNPNTVEAYADLLHFDRFLTEALDLGVELFALVGKEPFADTRGISLLRFLDSLLKHRYFRYGVVTNGTLIDRYFDLLPKSIAYIDISLDGPEEVNDRIRGEGVFYRATSNMRKLMDQSYEVWTSTVLHMKTNPITYVKDFMRHMIDDVGCGRFYFSPVRNFTGCLDEFLLSFDEIRRTQDLIANLAETTPGLDAVILDHPYEAVWRDYIWPRASVQDFDRSQIVTDEFGNVLRVLSARCFQKLDIFPHGPWGTCRVDVQGAYLADVESRAFASPRSVGSIMHASASSLFAQALNTELRPMLERFLSNMRAAADLASKQPALTSVSIPQLIQRRTAFVNV
jgi:uncharacterized Fe-S cluster-containing radical SAM superfamily protein